MLKKFKEIFGKTDDIVREYPMVLLMAFLGAISLICYAHNDFYDKEYFAFVKFTMICCLGISLMFALKMLSQRIGKGILLEILGVAFLILLYLFLPEKKEDFTDVYAFLLIPTFILSHLLVSFVAFLGNNLELNFWQYNKNLFINIFLTAVFTGVLTGGVELAILAVDKLFDFNFSDRYYADAFYFLAIFGSCFIFLMFNEKGLNHLEKDGNYPMILKFFTQYILIPLLLIYAVILYFYSAKILINWELPRGWVSYLVLAYSVVGILAILLVHPLKQESTKSWVKVFSKIFYYTLIPLIVLLFTAIFTRILEYGYTEPRYFVLLLALWLTSVVLYFVFARKGTIKFVPISLFCFGLFALIFPYFNTFSVAKRSQKTQLEKILNENQLLENGKIDFSKKVTDTVADEVSDKMIFLAKRKEKEYILNYFPKKSQPAISQAIDKNNIYWIFRNSFVNVKATAKTNRQQLELYNENSLYDIQNYDYLLSLRTISNVGVTIGNDRLKAEYLYHDKLTIVLNDNERWELQPSLRSLMKKYENKEGRIPVPEISFEYDFVNYRAKIILKNLVKDQNSVDNIFFDDAYLLIKKK